MPYCKVCHKQKPEEHFLMAGHTTQGSKRSLLEVWDEQEAQKRVPARAARTTHADQGAYDPLEDELEETGETEGAGLGAGVLLFSAGVAVGYGVRWLLSVSGGV